MEILVMIIMVLVGFTFVLKLTFHSLRGIALTTLVVALFAGFSWEYAITMSKTGIADWLRQPDLMLDTAVLLAIDVACQIAFCITVPQGQGDAGLSKSRKVIEALLLWNPGILIFPVLLSLLTSLIFTMSGVEFAMIGWGLAATLVVAVPTLTFALGSLLPESDLRLELLFLVNLLIMALGIVTTVNGRTAATGTNEVQWGALAGVAAVSLAGTVAGMIINRRNTLKSISKLK